MITPEHLQRHKDESTDDFMLRLFENKANYEIDNYTIANLMNAETNSDYGESKYRKDYASYRRWVDYFNGKKGAITPEHSKYKESVEINPDDSQVSDKLVVMSEEDKKDPKFLLKAHGYDPNEWELIKSNSSVWNQHNKEDGTLTLYASKVIAKPKGFEYTLEDIKSEVQELMENHKTEPYTHTRYSSTGKMLELNISDLHLNKLGYIKGVYDDELAEKAFFHIINDVLTRTKNDKFEKILFIWSHDFFNIDNMGKTTTAGTPQDTTMRYSDMYKKGREMLIKGIDMIKQIAPVETVQVGANHDRLTSYTMSEVLHAWYRDDEHVTIDNDPLSRKYRRFGKCLIGFSHGNQERTRLGKIMPSETRVDWGKTLYAEMHAAHIHSEKAVTEDNGVIVRHLSSPSGTDNWHFSSGWVGAIPKAQSFVWDRELGLTDIIHTPIIPNDKEVNQSVDIGK